MTNQRKIQPNTNSNQSYSLLTTFYTREIQKYIINNWFLFLSQLLQKLIPYSFKYLYHDSNADNANTRRNTQSRDRDTHDNRRNQSRDNADADNAIR